MGSPESGAGVGDCSVGSIVWVRRRNGSWWPGKILGPDELSASHVMSPRSGTPVKLLGREDASVDWYNLEKSKRVKAFRCGEFDDCIERAEASQGMPPKKREKYARREDAILHALDLERQMLEKKYGKVGYSSNGKSKKSPHGAKKEPVMSSANLEIRNRKQLNLKTQEVCKNLCSPLEHKSEDQDLFPGINKEENQLSADDDNSGVAPRMRGLQDLGLRTAPSILKTSPSVLLNGSNKPSFDSTSHIDLDGGLSTEGTANENCENLSDKGKRSHEGLDDDSPAKRRDRHLPLVQVLQNSSKLPISHLEPDGSANFVSMSEEEQPGIALPTKRNRYTYLTSDSQDGLSDTKVRPARKRMLPAKFEESTCLQASDSCEEDAVESTEDTETDSSETDSLDSDSDELASLSEGAASIELQPKYPGRSEARQEYESLSSEELDDLELADEASHPNDPSSTSMGVSRWQLKGKRNNRSLLKRPPDGSGRNFIRGYTGEITSAGMSNDGQNETYLIEKNFRSRTAAYGSRGPDGMACRTMQWEHCDWNDQPAAKGYWEDSGEYFDPAIASRLHNAGKIMLIDVDLRVQSSYQREHVPMISLMSKINGQAIVGHPIPIEALENGSTESLLVETDDWCPETLENDRALPPTWRTARRTANFRIPRPDLSSTCDESGKNVQFVDGGKGSSGKSNSGTFANSAGIIGKHVSNLPVERKLSRKPLKKISLSSNPKIRTLSSIASQQKQSSDLKRSGNSYQVDGVIKPESLPTAVACIPVKLVFSRLQEELIGRHP